MKRSLPLLFGLFVVCALVLPRGALFAEEERPSWVEKGDSYEESQGRGLVLKTNPSNARVFIDGLERGTTPFRLESIRPGVYYVRVVKEGYKERRFRIMIRPGAILELSLELEEAKGRVFVRLYPAENSPGPESLPFAPRLWVDGSSVDSMSLELAVGWRTITARAFGWEDKSAEVFVTEDSVQSLYMAFNPAAFRLSNVSLGRTPFNPSNAGSLGTTELSFQVSSPAEGVVSIRNSYGEEVFSTDMGPFTTWSQHLSWDGRDRFGNALPDGAYTVTVETRSIPWDGSEPKVERAALPLEIDSSYVIRPLTIAPGKSGLLFAPSPDILPPGAFQVEGGLFFGNPPESGAPWTSLPFFAAARFSPLEALEIAGAVDALPVFGKSATLGIGGSVKWAVINPAAAAGQYRPVPGFALGAVFSWAKNASVTPFGMGSGIEVFFPLSLGYSGFSFLLTPALLWTGDKGFPWEPAPRLLLSGGVMFKTEMLSAGISARSEYRYSLADSGFYPPFLAVSGEVKFFPLLSNLVFSLYGGVWIRGSALGGFGGAGIGMIY